MANLRKQKEALVNYFEAGCKPVGKLTVGLEVEHFITGTDGSPVSFEQVQQVMKALQQTGDVPVVMDGEYVGFYNDAYALSLEPACQLEMSMPLSAIELILRSKICHTAINIFSIGANLAMPP